MCLEASEHRESAQGVCLLTAGGAPGQAPRIRMTGPITRLKIQRKKASPVGEEVIQEFPQREKLS